MSDATENTTAVPTDDATTAPGAAVATAEAAPAPDAVPGTPDALDAAANGVAELTPEALQRIYDWARDTFDEEAAEFFVTRLEAASPDQVRTIIIEALEPYATEEKTRAIVAEALANHPTRDDLRTETRANRRAIKKLRRMLENCATKDELASFATKAYVHEESNRTIRWTVGTALALATLLAAIFVPLLAATL